jgi:hypothetical protein
MDNKLVVINKYDSVALQTATWACLFGVSASDILRRNKANRRRATSPVLSVAREQRVWVDG